MGAEWRRAGRTDPSLGLLFAAPFLLLIGLSEVFLELALFCEAPLLLQSSLLRFLLFLELLALLANEEKLFGSLYSSLDARIKIQRPQH